MTVKKEQDKITFEEAFSELEKIVRSLETGEADLQASISLYEKGVELKNLCEAKLKEAQAKIEKISIDSEGKVSASPAEDL